MTSAKKEKRQQQKFIELAREISADENEAAFKERLRRVARQKTPDKGNKPNDE